jgi:hypothetical protein
MYIDFMKFDVSLVIFILAGFTVIELGWIVYLHIKMSRLLRGKNAQSLEDTIHHIQVELHDLQKFEKESLAYFADVEKRLHRSIQAIETVRFNPFKGTGEGGNQSFSTALMSERGDGVIVSSMYSRDRVSIFSKPLSKFQSEFELTDEEAYVRDTAKARLKSS